jgi:ubiquinone/menaquinone biosynthesis C-methylase UbiE
MVFTLENSSYREIIRKCYREFLNREPDPEGWNHYILLMRKNEIDEKKLIDIFKNSPEYKLSHPIELEPNTPTEIRMKKEWDARAKLNILQAITPTYSNDYNDFLNTGISDCDAILGMNDLRFNQIIKNKDPSKMQILEIGCGIGRLLIPMSKIFGEAIGVDISQEMVQQGQKHVKNLSNCKILENNGTDLSLFPNSSFDFCYSYLVFQHIPDKRIIEKYISEASRILKHGCLFRFQVRGIIDTKPQEITTWDGVQFNSEEMHMIAKKNNFEIIEEENDKDEYYWLTFKSLKFYL